MATDLSELKDKTALITGASSGIGRDMARLLAAAGCHLVLVARSRDRLTALAEELRRAHGVTIDLIAMDLSHPNAARSLHEEVAGWARPIDYLISNAGAGVYGWFLDAPWQAHRAMLDLNVMAPCELIWLFGNDMRKRGAGRILVVASLAGHQASPTYASYSGSKAFQVLLGESLDVEWRGSGVTITVLSPGMTRTGFHEAAGHAPGLIMRAMMADSTRVAQAGIRGMLRGKALVVPGVLNTLLEWSKRFGPRFWLKWIAYVILKSRALK
jgi:short-subunit dehydrogenase